MKNKLYLFLECTDKPGGWAISEGWTCKTYVDRGYDMNEYCSRKNWIDGKLCGATCIKYGIITDPNCAPEKLDSIGMLAR